MPMLIIAEKGRSMKKRGFLDYGKDDERDERQEDDEEEEGAHDKHLLHLAEKTGVDDPRALVKLIKACMEDM